MKKTMFKRLKAALVAATMGATLSGCTEKEIRDEYNKEKESILNEIEEKLNKQNEDLKNYIDGKRVTETTTQTTTETTYTQTLETTTETITTESNTTELTYYTTESKEQTAETTTETMPSVYVKNRYKINQYGLNSVAEYTVTKENGEYLYSIARKFDKENTNETLKNIKELNKINENDNFISTNRTILLPFDVLYYITKPGEDLFDVSFETGISTDELIEKNNITDINQVLGSNKGIILTMLRKGETSFQTENGIANIYQNNVVYANKLIASTGYSGASNHLLALTETSETENYVDYIKFDGNGNYTKTLVAINVEDIKSEDGCPVIVTNGNTEVYGSKNNFIKIEQSKVKTLK